MWRMCVCVVCFVFFFKQKTAYEMRISDWSSDVCSSDLQVQELVRQFGLRRGPECALAIVPVHDQRVVVALETAALDADAVGGDQVELLFRQLGEIGRAHV